MIDPGEYLTFLYLGLYLFPILKSKTFLVSGTPIQAFRPSQPARLSAFIIIIGSFIVEVVFHSKDNLRSSCRHPPAVPSPQAAPPIYQVGPNTHIQRCLPLLESESEGALQSHYERSDILLVVHVIQKTRKKQESSKTMHEHHHRMQHCPLAIQGLS